MPSVAAILITLGGLLALANWRCAFLSCTTKKFHSAVPFFGAALIGAGMLMLSSMRPYACSALILDYGTLAFLVASPSLIRDAWRVSRFNLLSKYVGAAGRKTVHLQLYRRGIFTIRLHINRPAGECGLVGTGTVGTWQRDGARLTLHTGRDSATFDVVRSIPPEALLQSEGFDSWEANDEQSLASIEFIQTVKRDGVGT